MSVRLDRVRGELREHGHCVVEGVLSAAEVADVRERLWAAAEESERRGVPTRDVGIDRNDRNVRVFNLLDLDPVFRELIQHPTAIELVRMLLGESFLISNFTANIAEPGSGSMFLHSDQAIVTPPPWLEPQAMNVAWMLDDFTAENGATRYVPGSHRWSRREDVPPVEERTLRPVEGPAGSVYAMDGRLWHTSGANRTAAEPRAALFGYYTADTIRPQANWGTELSAGTLAGIGSPLREWLGLDRGNLRRAEEFAADRSLWGPDPP